MVRGFCKKKRSTNDNNLMEPWDGPAAMAFTEGTQIGAFLDRNGLHPSRYYVTKDDQIIFGSEAGTIEIPPENICIKTPYNIAPNLFYGRKMAVSPLPF